MARSTRKILGIPAKPVPGLGANSFASTSFWTEAKVILGRILSKRCRLEIEEATNLYMFEVDHGVSAAKIAKNCGKLVKAMDQFRQTFQSTLRDPEIGLHIEKMITDDSANGATDQPNWLDDRWWSQFDGVRQRLLDEKEECGRSEHLDLPENKPWTKWVRHLASVLSEDSFAVTVFSYESRNDRRPPTPFVKLVTLLQAQLPERFAQHEPTRVGHPYFAINKAIQRALHGSKAKTDHLKQKRTE